MIHSREDGNVNAALNIPCNKMATNTPQTPRKTELKGAIPSAARSSSIEHHSARFCGTETRGTS